MFKDLPEGETHSFNLAYCETCAQMTNHFDDGGCAKCEVPEDVERTRDKGQVNQEVDILRRLRRLEWAVQTIATAIEAGEWQGMREQIKEILQ